MRRGADSTNSGLRERVSTAILVLRAMIVLYDELGTYLKQRM